MLAPGRARRSVEAVGQRHIPFAKFSVNLGEIDLSFKGSVHLGPEAVWFIRLELKLLKIDVVIINLPAIAMMSTRFPIWRLLKAC